MCCGYNLGKLRWIAHTYSGGLAFPAALCSVRFRPGYVVDKAPSTKVRQQESVQCSMLFLLIPQETLGVG